MACRCVPPSQEQGIKSYNEANVIIKGTVLNASEGFSQLGPIIKIKVNEIIKGKNVPDEIIANYNDVTAACGNIFEVEKDYVIALYDTRSLQLTDSNSRGYGFRVMVSCHQSQVLEYLKSLEIKNNIMYQKEN